MRRLCLVLLLLACRGRGAEGELRGAAQLAASEAGEIGQRAVARLVQAGPAALPTIEAALHGAPPQGRRNLVMALRRIGAAEAAPLLGHLAAYDEDDGVRVEARWTLRAWVAQGGERARAAAAALRKVDELRSTEETG